MQQFRSTSRVRVAFQPEDDIDTLFTHLRQLEPPGEVITRIITHIGRLPRPDTLPSPSPNLTENEEGGEGGQLVVRNEWRDPA